MGDVRQWETPTPLLISCVSLKVVPYHLPAPQFLCLANVVRGVLSVYRAVVRLLEDNRC